MKVSKTALAALGAGIALAGAAGLLPGTERRRALTRNWRKRGELLVDDLSVLANVTTENTGDTRQPIKPGSPKEKKGSAPEPTAAL